MQSRDTFFLKIKASIPLKDRGFLLGCAHLGSNQGPKDYESSVLLFFIAVCQVVMAKTLFVAKLLLNKATDSSISYSNIRK